MLLFISAADYVRLAHVTADGEILPQSKERERERWRKGRDLFFDEAKCQVPLISGSALDDL